MNLKILLFIFPIILLLGCVDNNRVCNTPYIPDGMDCCLDLNENKICDLNETTTTILIPTTSNPPVITTTTTLRKNYAPTSKITDCESIPRINSSLKAKCYYERVLNGSLTSCDVIVELFPPGESSEELSVRQFIRMCYFRLGITQKNASLCHMIKDSREMQCLVLMSKNTSYCEELPADAQWFCNETAKGNEDLCLTTLAHWPDKSRYGCQGEQAITYAKPSLCDRLQDIKGKSYCYCYYCSYFQSKEMREEFNALMGLDVCEEAKKVQD